MTSLPLEGGLNSDPRAGFGASQLKGFHVSEELDSRPPEATGAQKRWPSCRGPSRPASACAAEELGSAGDPAGQGLLGAHRYRMTAKHKSRQQTIFNLFLGHSWIQNPFGNQDGLIPLSQNMRSFTYPSSFRRSTVTLPLQVKQEQIAVRKSVVSRAFSHTGGLHSTHTHTHTAVCGSHRVEREKNTLKRTVRLFFTINYENRQNLG